MLDVCLLGTGGMMPMPDRFLSSMMLRLNGRLFLVDSGEGTQVTLKSLGWGFKAIEAIFFTHFHADHISGLPGMLLAIANAGRTEKLKLIGPKGLVPVVEGLCTIAQDLPFDIEYLELENDYESISLSGITVENLFVDHSVPCTAYRFYVERKGKFDAGKAEALCLPKSCWSSLQKGLEVEFNGRIVKPQEVMGVQRRGIKVSYCTDSRPTKALPDFISKSDLFVCEGMYGENEKLEKALVNKHMLFSEAALLAKEGLVHELWLTHFSPALSEPESFLQNAKEIFDNTKLGFDRKVATLYFDNGTPD